MKVHPQAAQCGACERTSALSGRGPNPILSPHRITRRRGQASHYRRIVAEAGAYRPSYSA